jgi:hypothetical protein
MRKPQPQLLPFDPDTGQHYLEQLHAVISDYFRLTGKPKYEMIFYRRCHYPADRETLDGIGKDFNVTRERIRQLANICCDQILSILKGETLKKPSCVLSEGVRQYLRVSVEKYCRDGIIIKKDLIEDAEVSLPEDKQHYIYHLELLMESLGYNRVEYKEQEYYITEKSIIKLGDICNSLVKYLHDRSLTVSLDDLTEHMKLSSTLVKTALKLLPEAVEVEYEHYRIADDQLLIYSDRAYRILKEYGKPMHFQDINKAIKASKTLTGARLRKDKRLVGIGKTGMWGLAEWHLNTDTIIDLILNALKFIARPATYGQITAIIQMARPEISYNTIVSYISNYRGKFKWIDKRTIALREWKDTVGEDKPVGRRKNVIDMQVLKRAVIEAVGDQTMSAREIADKIAHIITQEPPRILMLRIYRLPVLEKVNTEGLAYFRLNPKYTEHMGPRNTKWNAFVEEAHKILSKKGSMLLSELLGKLVAKGFNRVSMYAVIRNDERFVTRKGSGRNKIVSLSGDTPHA